MKCLKVKNCYPSIMLAFVLGCTYIHTLGASQVSRDSSFSLSGYIKIKGCDSVELHLHTYFLPLSINSFEKIMLPVINGRFEYERAKPVNGRRPFNLGIYPYVNGQATGLLTGRNLFLALPGDQVALSVENDVVEFSGRGAQKYHVRWAIERITSKRKSEGTLSQVAGGHDGAEKINDIEAHYDSLYAEKVKYIDTYRDSLTDEEYRILRYDALGTRQYMFLRTVSIIATALGSKDSLLKQHYRNRFQRVYQGFEPDTVDSELKAFAQNFSEYSFAAIHLMHALQRGGGADFQFGNEHAVYDYISKQYRGLLRDKLLTICVQGYSARDQNNVLLSDACRDISDPFFSKLVCSKLSHVEKGAQMPAFELTDAAGARYTFTPEKGKITLIDLWYTGCGACALISDRLHDFFDATQNEPDFRLISVSIDKSMNVWKSSIASGKYTHPSAQCFYTNGMGSRHPMTMHFDVKSYPRFILIDREGKIVSSHLYPTLESISEAVAKALGGV